jgi:carbonic anhydrase/acetyltransferase-like protein (isoleucine patch superfamily)
MEPCTGGSCHFPFSEHFGPYFAFQSRLRTGFSKIGAFGLSLTLSSEVFDDPMIRRYQGHLPNIPASCYVDLSAQVIGDVELGEHSSVWMNAVLRGDVNSIRVGSNSNVQDCAVLHGQRHLYSVTVGDWVTIGHNATVHGCVVEDAVLIGMGVTILNDCRIGEGSIIAAGAVLPERTVVPPRTLWAGVPGKQRRELGDQDRKLILEYAQNYLDYTKIYLAEADK